MQCVFASTSYVLIALNIILLKNHTARNTSGKYSEMKDKKQTKQPKIIYNTNKQLLNKKLNLQLNVLQKTIELTRTLFNTQQLSKFDDILHTE